MVENIKGHDTVAALMKSAKSRLDEAFNESENYDHMATRGDHLEAAVKDFLKKSSYKIRCRKWTSS